MAVFSIIRTSPQMLPTPRPSCPRKRASSKRRHLCWRADVRHAELGDYWVPAFAGTTAESVATSSRYLRLAQRGTDALRRRRDFLHRHAERRQRVVDGVDNRGRRADAAAFAQTL